MKETRHPGSQDRHGGKGWHRLNDWSLGRKSAAAVVLPLTLLLIALAFSYRVQQNIIATDADVRRALTIQTEIQSLHSLIAESATAVRGHLLTGREDFLAPYWTAREQLPASLAALRLDIRDAEMKQRLQRIERLLALKLQSLETLRAEGRTLAAAELQLHLLSSKRVLDELRAEIRAMSAREADLLRQYSDAARRALQRNLWVDAITSVLVLLTGLAAYVLLFRGVVWRVDRLAINAERLTQGEPLVMLPAARDELGLLAERLQNASLLLAARAAEAQSASLAKTQFLSRTSHELRTPLNAILGFAQLLQDDLSSPPQVAAVEQILTAGQHLLALVDEVLDIARIEAGELQLLLSPQIVGPVAQEALDVTAALARRHGITVQLEPALATVAVSADRKRLLQALINLVSNAIKYNRPGGSAVVGVRSSEDQVWITVRDTGVGLDAAAQQRLFTPFDRLGAEARAIEGTGLGLAVSRQLLRQMGGEIEVHSTPGEGSEFALRMQRAVLTTAALPVAAPVATPPAGKADTTGHSLLLIEDNASNIALVQALVARRPGWHVVVARDGRVGLAQARTLRPALILLDLNLPGVGGEGVLVALRAEPATAAIPIVIVSADASPSTIERQVAAGASAYLTKPLSVPQVLDWLDRSAA